MLEDVIQYSKDSWGLIPLMVVVFIIGIAVIIERYFSSVRVSNEDETLTWI